MIDALKITADTVLVTDSDIAFFGCSYTYGTALPSTAKRYSTIISQHYGKKEINLAKGGTGNYRTFDLFGQIEFSAGSMLVVQIAELSRVRWYNDRIIDQQLSVNPDKILMHVYNDKFLIYDLIRQLRIIVNYCRSKQIKFVIWSNASLGNTNLDDILEQYLGEFPEYLYVNKRINQEDSYRIDNAIDGRDQPLGAGHPGPESHKIIASRLINHFTQLY
jgi:hypothetical protein